MTPLFRFDRKDETYAPVFQEAVTSVEKLLRDRKVVTELMKPIAIMYPMVTGTRKPPVERIGDLVMETIAAGFEVTADAQSHTVMQISAHNNHLRVNPQFLNYDETDQLERDRYLLLLVLKLSTV